MSMMLQGGRWAGKQLLSPTTVNLAIAPHSSYVYKASQLRKMDIFYGLHWSVYSSAYAALRFPVSNGSFGHGGSDGTLAWADPEQKLIGVYLTQSRGTTTGRRIRNMVQAAIVE